MRWYDPDVEGKDEAHRRGGGRRDLFLLSMSMSMMSFVSQSLVAASLDDPCKERKRSKVVMEMMEMMDEQRRDRG